MRASRSRNRFCPRWNTSLAAAAFALAAAFACVPLRAQVNVAVNAGNVLSVMPDVGIGLHTSVYSNNFAQPTLPGIIGAGGIQMLRYPGGNYADIYHWSSHTATPGGYAASASHFGNFVDLLMDGSGATGMVTVNYGNSHLGTMPGQPKEAAAWVAYANGDPNDTRVIGVDEEGNNWRTVGYWATLRGMTPAQNPDNLYDRFAINHDAPLGIQYWEIGNELNGNGFYGTNLDWQYDLHAPYTNGVSCGTGCTDYPNRVGYPGGVGYNGGSGSAGLGPADYGQNFIEFHDAMKFVDPTIKVGAVLVGSGTGNTASASTNWDIQVMQTAGETMDFGIYHFYVDNGSSTNAVLNATDDLPAEFDLLRSRMNTYIHPGAADEIEIHMTEFGYFGTVASPAVDGVFAANTYATALEDGVTSVHWLELNKNSYLGDGAPVLGPAYYGIQIFSHIAEAGSEFVQTTSSSGSVEVHSTVLPDGSVGVLIANLNSSGSSTVNIDINGVDLDESGTQWLYGVSQTTPLETSLATGLGNTFSVSVPFRSIMALLIAPVPTLLGDFNGDGTVDEVDYTVWRDGLGTVYTTADYDDWKAHFGETLPGGGSASSRSVPEPSSLLMLSLAALLAAAAVWRGSPRSR